MIYIYRNISLIDNGNLWTEYVTHRTVFDHVNSDVFMVQN